MSFTAIITAVQGEAAQLLETLKQSKKVVSITEMPETSRYPLQVFYVTLRYKRGYWAAKWCAGLKDSFVGAIRNITIYWTVNHK